MTGIIRDSSHKMHLPLLLLILSIMYYTLVIMIKIKPLRKTFKYKKQQLIFCGKTVDNFKQDFPIRHNFIIVLHYTRYADISQPISAGLHQISIHHRNNLLN